MFQLASHIIGLVIAVLINLNSATLPNPTPLPIATVPLVTYPSPSTPPFSSSEPNTTTAEIISVIDGDTISVKIGHQIQKVRIIGVDTKELHDKNPLNRCFANLAKAFIQSLISSTNTVLLESDPTQGNTDRYQRLLRHVKTQTGINVAEELIKSGLGIEYTYKKPHTYQSLYRSTQTQAQANKSGIWSHVCP